MDLSILATSLGAHSWAAVDAAASALSHWASTLDSLWNWPPLNTNRWNAAMKGFHVLLTLVTAGLLLYEWRAEKLGEVIPLKWKMRVAAVLTVLGFASYYDFGNPNTRYADYYHRHEFYHYYLGSKYFREVGYLRLYECTLIAEIENGRAADIRQRELRDLRINLIKPATDTYVFQDPAQCKSHFSPPRWEAFKQDINWFYNSARGSYWEGMQKDHGYNPPPVWTMSGKFFGSFGPADDVYFKLLSCLDVFLQLGAVLLIRWAFGWRAMAIATVWWGCNAPANFYWTGGAFLRQDWIFFLVAAFALAKKRMFVLSGATLTWSALLRIFPMILFAGPAIIMLLWLFRRWRIGTLPLDRQKVFAGVALLLPLVGAGVGAYLHHRAGADATSSLASALVKGAGGGIAALAPLAVVVFWPQTHWTHRRFIFGCVVAAGLLIPASIIATGGPESYQHFYQHTIGLHNRTPLTNHMGLETIVVSNWEGRMRFGRNDNLDDPFEGWKNGRLDRFDARKPLFLGIVAILGLWTVWALRRTKFLWMGMALSLPLTFALTNLTCYYYCMYMLAVAVALVRKPFAPAYLAVSGASQILLHAYYYVDDQFVSISYLFLLLSVLMLYSYSRPFSLERLKAWWEGKPEPKSPKVPKLAPAPAE